MPMRNPANLVKDAGRFLSAGDKLSRSGLSLRHMRMIVALDDHGRVSAAAQVMNISQPAASRCASSIAGAVTAPRNTEPPLPAFSSEISRSASRISNRMECARLASALP